MGTRRGGATREKAVPGQDIYEGKVKAADPECPTMKDARGYRKIGDTILMRTSQDRYDLIERSREYQRLTREKGVDGALRELGDKYRDKGFIVHDDIKGVKVGRQGKSVMDVMETKARQTGARQAAMKGVDTMLHDGTVPGMPPLGKGRR